MKAKVLQYAGFALSAAFLLCGALFFVSCSQQASMPTAQPAAPAPSPLPSVADEASSLTPVTLSAVEGTPLQAVSVADNWLTYENTQAGFRLQYPPDWSAIEMPGGLGVRLLPPGAPTDSPTSQITIFYADQLSYEEGRTINNTNSTISAITVADVTGQAYKDSAMAIPFQSYYVELPYRSGTMMMSATMGPSVSLVDQFQEILATFQFSQ